jgi:hypothetical protein
MLLMLSPVACGRAGSGAVDIAVIGTASGDLAGTAAARAGLVGFDGEGRLIPALAERWIVADDALGYIFRLRDGTWSDGTPIAAADVVAALRKAIAAQRDTGLGRDLAGIRSIRVMARRVIEIDLDAPQPDLLALLAQPELGVLAGPHGQHHTGPMDVRRDGDAWLATLTPAVAGARALALRYQSATDAVARFGQGKADLVLGGTVDSLPLATGASLARGNLLVEPVAGLFGLEVMQAQGFLADPANREALAMAIDRDGLVAAFGVSGWQATTRIVSPGLDGDGGLVGERWADQSLDQRRALAATRVKAWIAANAKAGVAPGAPVLTLALPAGRGGDLLFARLHDDSAAIGITLVRVAPDRLADVRLVDSVARYPHARWFLQALGCGAHRAVCSAAGDSALQAAIRAADGTVAARGFADAEAQITAANGFVPLARPLRWSLVRGTVAGFFPSAIGWHPLPPLAGGDAPANP